MKTLIGILLIVLEICLGLYVGLWVMFVGGIIQVIQSCTPVVNSIGIAIGLLKIVCANAVGYVSFYVLFGIGILMLK